MPIPTASRRAIALLAPLAVVVALAAASSARLFDGGGRTIVRYTGKLACAGGDTLTMFTELDSLLFRLNSVQSKYKVVRVTITNGCASDIRLDPAHDAVTAKLARRTITGIIDLAARDHAIWNAMEPDLRRELAYPPAVPHGGEEENIYVFFAEPKLIELPQSLQYTIASTGKVIDVTRPRSRTKS